MEEVRTGVVNVVGEIAKAHGHGDDEIELETRLGADLGFSSMDIIHLMASIDMRFNCKLKYDLFFRRADQFVEDFSVTEIADFVFDNFDNQVIGPVAM
jgi:acyl carrier protein